MFSLGFRDEIHKPILAQTFRRLELVMFLQNQHENLNLKRKITITRTDGLTLYFKNDPPRTVYFDKKSLEIFGKSGKF